MLIFSWWLVTGWVSRGLNCSLSREAIILVTKFWLGAM
jgi:hypothetical protein